MATATSQKAEKQTDKPPMPIATKLRYVLIALVAAVTLWILFNFADMKAKAQLGTAYAAHIGCSCRYIEGRPLNACRKDFEPGMGMVSLTDDDAHKRVTASVPLLASAVAERRGTFGCLQLNAKEIDALE